MRWKIYLHLDASLDHPARMWRSVFRPRVTQRATITAMDKKLSRGSRGNGSGSSGWHWTHIFRMRLAFGGTYDGSLSSFFFLIFCLTRTYISFNSVTYERSSDRFWHDYPYLRARERVERASANCEMQEFKKTFFIRSATTPGVIVVIARAIKARARPCKVRRMYLFIVRRNVRVSTFPKSISAENRNEFITSKYWKIYIYKGFIYPTLSFF